MGRVKKTIFIAFLIVLITGATYFVYQFFTTPEYTTLTVHVGSPVNYAPAFFTSYSISYGVTAGEQHDLLLILPDAPAGTVPQGQTVAVSKGDTFSAMGMQLKVIDKTDAYIVLQIKPPPDD
jgi:hypothetical protein